MFEHVMLPIVYKSWSRFSALFSRATFSSIASGSHAELYAPPGPDLSGLEPAPGSRTRNRYYLKFCLRSLDNGTTENSHLQPVVNETDAPMQFSSMAALLQVRNKLIRVSDDLVYYAVPIDTNQVSG